MALFWRKPAQPGAPEPPTEPAALPRELMEGIPDPAALLDGKGQIAAAQRSREAGGTGIGLAIVKHLVQAQDGQVGVESGRGGSRFWVRLPVPP